MKKKAQISLYIMFFFAAVIIILMGAVIAPIGTQFVSKMYIAGEDLLLKSNETIQGINDTTVRAEVQQVLDSAMASQQNNIEVTANIFQYSWVAVLGLVGLILFIYTRQLVELGGGFV